jgi:ABC-type transport system involved in multi-copper enzyme maturation permease subunit
MTPIEIIAVVFSIVILIRSIIFLSTKPQSLVKAMEKMFPKTTLLTIMFLVVGAVVSYYILQELTIAQVMASILLGLILVGLVIVQFPKEFLNLAKAIVENKGKVWLSGIIIVALAIWVLVDVFGAF